MIAGILIVLIGLTGSLLVFEPELNSLLHPNLYKVTEGKKVTYQEALRVVSEVNPKDQIDRVYTPSELWSKDKKVHTNMLNFLYKPKRNSCWWIRSISVG